MKLIVVVASLMVLSLMTGCNKCESENLVCEEKAPTDELCQAFFTRWFYDNSSKTCEQIGYSGCSQRGFETKADCEECDCR